MKNLCLAFVLLWSFSGLQAQTATETRTLKAFDQVVVNNAIEAEFVRGDQHSIEITASGIGLEEILADVNKRTLEVGISGTNPKSSSVKVKVTYARLEMVEVTTGAKAFIREALESKSISLSTATNAYLEAEVKAGELFLEAKTNSKMYVKGGADRLDYNAFTNAEIDGENLVVKHAEVRTNTNAFGSFEVTESLKGTAATRGRIKYKGDPSEIDVKESIGGTIEAY
ncbi:Putative auto-transporter adhesin, head GIN domain [Cyclobacterium lianum]|uniref:Putative auto-transporter adhesin, head GIN domain n=1 Tax=Cyclobacterium lianum TaxID=388280 RepID=A0A1M7QSE7_9BACT|nr:DUF2807 domain-containing protein [Cyclobacterium lianum]SHN34609.1 Putative auto-transporter adhesin, head GIN domain [Cyclobacterium lianum]